MGNAHGENDTGPQPQHLDQCLLCVMCHAFIVVNSGYFLPCAD